MNLLPDAEQQAVVDTAAAFLAKELPAERVRALAAAAGGAGRAGGTRAGPDRELWARMGALGWFALGVPEERGGAGYGLVEEALLFRELGRALAPGPFVAQVLASHVAMSAGTAGAAVLEQIASGETVVGLAQRWDAGDGPWQVFGGTGASLLLTVEATGDLRLVETPGAVSAGEGRAGIDPLTPICFADLDAAPVVAGVGAGAGRGAGAGAGAGVGVGAAGAGAGGRTGLIRRGRVLAAAMLVGICEATRDESAAHAKERVQFGRPIGAFQAVKHRCADMCVRAEAAGSLTFLAALSLREDSADAGVIVTQAKALAGEYALANAADDIQNHGGMGFTADCNAHLYLKRANVLATMLGSPAALWPETVR